MSPFTMSSERCFTEWKLHNHNHKRDMEPSRPSPEVLSCSFAVHSLPLENTPLFSAQMDSLFPARLVTGTTQDVARCVWLPPLGMVILKSPMSLSISIFLLQNAQSHSTGCGITICVEGGNWVVSSFWNAVHCTDIHFPISWVYTLGVRLLGHTGHVRLAL